MPKYLILLLLTVFFINAKAQSNTSKKAIDYKVHQISANAALSTAGLAFKIDGKLNWKTDSFSYKGSSKPAIQLGYDYYFNKNISIGILGSSQTMNMKVNYLIFKNVNELTKRYNDIDIKVDRRYIGLRCNFHFINNTKSDLYTALRFGSVFWKISPSITDSDLDEKLETSFPGTLLPALALGYKYKIKETVGVGIELSVGTPHVFAYGIDARF